MLKLRNTDLNDLEITYKWASNFEIRKFSISNSVIKKDDHEKWLKSKLMDKNSEYFILMESHEYIGSVRFDIEDAFFAKVSYQIDPTFHGNGFGKKILDMGMRKLLMKRPFIVKVHGVVMKNNIASIAIFNRLGFKNVFKDSKFLKFEKDL